MTGAREIVLSRIRGALTLDCAAPIVSREYRRQGRSEPGATELLDLLEDRTLEYRAGFLRATPASLPGRVAAALAGAGSGPRRIIIPPGLDRSWVAETDDEIIVDDPTMGPAQLDTVDAVVTACALAIAETGTIVLDGTSDQGRRAITLVPDVHVCVVHAQQVVETVPDAVARLNPRRAMTWISGPSATSDIELARVEGVHGPRQLIVVLVRPG